MLIVLKSKRQRKNELMKILEDLIQPITYVDSIIYLKHWELRIDDICKNEIDIFRFTLTDV